MQEKIMIIDDDKSMCELLESTIKRKGYSPAIFTSAENAFERLIQENFDVIITDLKIRGMDGIELCNRVAVNWPDIPVIIITAFGSMQAAISAIRAGAYDFIPKPFDIDIFNFILERAVKHRTLNKDIKRLNAAMELKSKNYNLIGESEIMKKLFDLITRSAQTEATILITGESGTGKELVAKALHKQSKRNTKPFIAVNCSAIPETLLESELFGYKRGAFTDAKSDKKGLFIQADGGTLFLDEIGEIPLALQAKLLRTLEEHTIRPLGAEEEIQFDVRLLAATNKNTEALVKKGSMREDLYYRLNVINIEVPPLRLRGNDILLLANHFLHYFSSVNKKQVSSIAQPAMQRLLDYNWPGNVRELRNIMERAVALTNYNQIIMQDLPEHIRNFAGTKRLVIQNNNEELITMDEVERRYIGYVLKKTDNNKSLTARILGFDRKTLYNKLEYYNL